MQIPLPTLTQSSNQAHPYPFQVGFQTLEFVQGAIFHAALLDIAASEYCKTQERLDDLQQSFANRGLNHEVWEQGFSILRKYLPVFQGYVFQNVVITLNAHWDWYLRALVGFVSESIKHVPDSDIRRERGSPPFNSKTYIGSQISNLEQLSGVKFDIDADDLVNLAELSLVRNVGLHNRWEIDAAYLKHTKAKPGSVGELRLVTIDELQAWHESFVNVVNKISPVTAARFAAAPAYPKPKDAI